MALDNQGQQGTDQNQQGADQSKGQQGNNHENLLEQGGAQGGEDQSVPAIPEKFHVKKADGSLDDAATLAKFLTSYAALEKRIGTGELPPKDETGYKLDYSKFPEGVKIDAEKEKSFLKKMHGKGMTNAQVQAVMDEYGAVLGEGMQLQQGNINKALADARDELNAMWGTGSEQQTKFLQAAFAAVADEQDKENANLIGRDLKVTYKAYVKLLARLGSEMQEDSPVQGGGAVEAENIEALMKSEAYWKESHPDHKATLKKVQDFYAKKHSKKG